MLVGRREKELKKERYVCLCVNICIEISGRERNQTSTHFYVQTVSGFENKNENRKRNRFNNNRCRGRMNSTQHTCTHSQILDWKSRRKKIGRGNASSISPICVCHNWCWLLIGIIDWNSWRTLRCKKEKRERENSLRFFFEAKLGRAISLFIWNFIFSTITEWFKASAEMEERDDGVSSEVRVFFKPFV